MLDSHLIKDATAAGARRGQPRPPIQCHLCASVSRPGWRFVPGKLLSKRKARKRGAPRENGLWGSDDNQQVRARRKLICLYFSTRVCMCVSGGKSASWRELRVRDGWWETQSQKAGLRDGRACKRAPIFRRSTTDSERRSNSQLQIGCVCGGVELFCFYSSPLWI